jgi:hypothetical protein
LVYSLKPKSSNEICLNADEINDFFVSISLPGNSDQVPVHLPRKPAELIIPEGLSFTFQRLTQNEVTAAWLRTKNRLSSSCDTMGLCLRMLGVCCNILVLSHTTIYYHRECPFPFHPFCTTHV